VRRFRRYALMGLVVLAVGLLAAWIGLRIFLGTTYARSVAAGQLSAMVGLPVAVDDLDVGSSSTSVKLRILAPAEGSVPAAEIVRVDSASADVSVLDLVTGRAEPKKVVLKGVSATLELDAEGKLLTPMPKPVGGAAPAARPAVRIEDAHVTVNQTGRPSFSLGGDRLNAVQSGDGYTLDGAVADPKWGDWSVRGAVDLQKKTGFVELASADAPLDPDQLRSVPYVPPSTWNYVRPSGRAAATVRFESGTGTDSYRYAVTLRPGGRADLAVPEIGATLTKVDATIRAEGQRITIEDGKAGLAGGTVRASGDLDFAPEPSRMTFQVSADGVDVRQLPAEWGLPPQITGKLRGKADLTVLVPATGPVETRGGGEGTLDDATIAGLPAEVRLRLRGDGRRFRFDSEPLKDKGGRPAVGLRRPNAFRPQSPPTPTRPR